MPILRRTDMKDGDNVTQVNFVDEAGDPVNLTTLSATAVRAEICSPQISDVIDAESFGSNTAYFKFGSFDVPAGVYDVKIYYISPSKPNGELLAGKGKKTEFCLKVIC